MYQKNYVTLSYKEYQIHIPNWLLREKGISKNDIYWDGAYISIRNNSNKVKIQWDNNNNLSIGSFSYTTHENFIDLQILLISPELWLGNTDFTDFIGKSIFRLSRFEQTDSIKLEFPLNKNGSEKNVNSSEKIENAVDLYDLH